MDDTVFAMQSMQMFDLRFLVYLNFTQTLFSGFKKVPQFCGSVLLIITDTDGNKGIE